MQTFPSDKHWIRRRRNLGICDAQTAIFYGISTQARRFHRKKYQILTEAEINMLLWLSHTLSLHYHLEFFWLVLVPFVIHAFICLLISILLSTV